ncbi:MAG: ATP-binding protein [Kofleriaceae bacterium]
MTTARPLILYVDDEPGNRIVFHHSVGAEFNVQAVADAAAAIEVLESTEVALLITDIRMPGMSGDELLVQAKARWPATLRVVITAYNDVEPILRAINEGLVARYLVKPWDLDELVAMLRWGVDAYQFGRDSETLRARLLEVERLATLGSIASSTLHDIRAPLAVAALDARDLDRCLREPGPLADALAGKPIAPEAQAELAELANDLRERAQDISRNLDLTLSVTESLRQFMRRVAPSTEVPTGDARAAIQQALSICGGLGRGRLAKLSYAGPTALPPTALGTADLVQVLINVISNAVNAIGARKGGGEVVVRAHVDRDRLVIEVRDDGVGMTPEVLARAGKPFFTTRAEGTGLGLAQCKRILGALGGSVELASVEGSGTTVTLGVPLASARTT